MVDPPLQAVSEMERVEVVDMSHAGLRIRNRRALRVGEEIPVCVELCDPISSSVWVRVRVVWSHLGNERDDEGRPMFRSGLCVVDGHESMRRALAVVRSRAGESESQEPARPGIEADQVLMIRQARQYLRSHPALAVSCTERAREATSSETDDTSPDALAIHAFLEGMIPAGTIAWVLDHDREL